MLPSFIYRLPSGEESGIAVGVDLGGSTLRVGLIEFPGRRIVVRREWGIDDAVKKLRAEHFFDWIAERVGEVVYGPDSIKTVGEVVVGLTWSFPIE